MLELTIGLPGAYCGRLLAMLGADVVKVESPDACRRGAGGRDRRSTGSCTPRSARWRSTSPRVDGGDAGERLAADADVVLDDGALGAPPAVRARYDELLAADRRGSSSSRSRRSGSTARAPGGRRPS